MSYEQKYLKYKQKYQELKKRLNVSNVHKMETEVDIHDFVLTDTPTMDNNMTGGSGELDLSPIDETQYGGMAPLAPATFGPTVPLTSCPGQVNPMPDVSMGLSGMMSNLAANPQGPVPPAPLPQVGAGDEVASEEFNTTTDVSEIQNTEDIERLFNQFGGKRGRPAASDTEHSHTTNSSKHSKKHSSHDNSSSSHSSSSSASSSLSDFDDSLTVSDL